MSYAAIMYRVKPGHDDEIAEIFTGFQRMQTPSFTDSEGAVVGRLLGTAVFLQDDVVVRVIHYEGDFSAIGRHVGMQRGVHLIEDKLQPFLAEGRDTAAQADFEAYFAAATMRSISELTVDTLPATNR